MVFLTEDDPVDTREFFVGHPDAVSILVASQYKFLLWPPDNIADTSILFASNALLIYLREFLQMEIVSAIDLQLIISLQI